jgi:periplasmic protein TonB
VKATFIDAAEPERSWQPPVVTPSLPPINIAPPRVLPVDLAVELPARSRSITSQASLPAPQTPTTEPSALRLISAVEYVREPSPRYPPQSRRLREQGLVVLRVLIDEKGQACDITVESSSGHVRLDRAAKEAVARAAFRPYVEDGLPRRALVLIPIEFTLTSGSV